MRPWVLSIVALLILCGTVSARAQVPSIQPGARVRVDAKPLVRRPIVGTLMAQSPESLTIASSATAWSRIPVTAVSGIDFSGGISRSGGGALGFVVGTLVIGGLTAIVTIPNAKEPEQHVGQFLVVGAIVGTAAGYAIGAERWHRMYRPDATELPERDRLRIRGTP